MQKQSVEQNAQEFQELYLDFPKITGHFRLSGLSPLGGVNRGRKSQKNQTSVQPRV